MTLDPTEVRKYVTQEVDITPHPSLISKLGASGYRTYEAIAELIDNSIDARLESEVLKVEVTLDFSNKTVTVKDNAKGMGLETLRNAMTLAYTENDSESSRLGIYGLGMKTACSSLGENFYIDTKPIGETKRYQCSYKEKDWTNGDKTKWITFPIIEKEDNAATHGTIIKIEKLKVSLYPNLVIKFKKIFGMRYGPFLKSGQLDIWVNTLKCRPEEPEILAETKRAFKLKLPSENIVSGWGALLKRRRGEDYGFNLYRKNRLIKMYDKSLLGRKEHSAISMIIGNLNLDHVPVIYNKTDFLRESDEFKELASRFPEYEEFKGLKREAIQPKYAKEISELTKEKIKDITLNFLKQVNNIEKNDYHFPQKFKQGDEKKFLVYTTDLLGKKEKIVIKLGYLDEVSLKKVTPGKQLEILINQNSPAYKSARDKTLFINSQVAESIAYIIAKKRNLPVEEFKDLLDRYVNASANEIMKDRTTQMTKIDLKKENEKMLIEELQELNNYLKTELKTEFDRGAFYFTATSILGPYLTHIPRINYYFIYCDIGLGEKIQNKLIDKFKDDFLVILEPKNLGEYVDNLIKNTKLTKIIVIREKEREKTYRRDGSVASLEIALVDMDFEIDKKGLPITSSDIEDIMIEFTETPQLNKKRLYRYARRRGRLDYFKKHFGD